MDRRALLALPALGLLALSAAAQTMDTTGIDTALARFAALPGSTSYVIEAERTPAAWRAEINDQQSGTGPYGVRRSSTESLTRFAAAS